MRIPKTLAIILAGGKGSRLGDLTATTAAGSESVVAPNIPVEVAVALAGRATPGMLDDVLA